MPLTSASDKALNDADIRTRLIEIDRHWAEIPFWQAIANNKAQYSPYYLLASLDLKQNARGDIIKAPAGTSAFLDIFGRTFLISGVVTLLTLILGFPLAYWITTLPRHKANLIFICILIPFWTSVLVRIAAWIVLLQRQGLVNNALMSMGITDAPLALLFNRAGVYIAMTHILLPFMILPIYSVMQSVPNTYQRAAISLGSHPFAAFWRVYVPQTYAGIGAGTLLVFIIAIGYYITPALLGGADDQMISYYVAYFTNQTINWGMASALGFILLIGTLLLYSLYRKLSGRELGLG
jgi:putative spermidine/putrescine transport system permease protein